ncbi:MAG TPA: hypothetical protein VLY23_17590 [Candidatus Acidoferrum sp.]|nr:hypothetical protein [Candidatus Acidoferrum sp.]
MNQTVPPLISPPALARKARAGCMGCLVQCTVVLLLGCLMVVVLEAVLTPYIFTMGGSFHWYPWWSGWGKMHTSSGDYGLYVTVYPWQHGRLSSPLHGSGTVCTPRGEMFTMKLSGGLPPRVWRNIDGQPMSLDLRHQTWFYGFTNDHRPELSVRGVWHGPNLVMDDHGTLTRAFLPDGTAYTGPADKQPRSREVVQLTLTTGTYSDFKAACAAMKH